VAALTLADPGPKLTEEELAEFNQKLIELVENNEQRRLDDQNLNDDLSSIVDPIWFPEDNNSLCNYSDSEQEVLMMMQ